MFTTTGVDNRTQTNPGVWTVIHKEVKALEGRFSKIEDLQNKFMSETIPRIQGLANDMGELKGTIQSFGNNFNRRMARLETLLVGKKEVSNPPKGYDPEHIAICPNPSIFEEKEVSNPPKGHDPEHIAICPNPSWFS